MNKNINLIILHLYFFSINLAVSLLNKLGIVDNKILVEFSIAQVLIGTLSSIYLFRFNSLKLKINIDYFILAVIFIVAITIKNINSNLNWISIMVYSILLLIKDLLRLNTDKIKYKFSTILILILSALSIAFVPNVLFVLFLPIVFIVLKDGIPIFELINKINYSNFRYFLEDFPIFIFSYLIAVESFRYLMPNEYSNFRLIISLSSLSALLQYVLFQYYEEIKYEKTKIHNIINISVLLVGTILYLLFQNFEIISTYTLIVSGIYYFYLKSILKIKYLIILNSASLILYYFLFTFYAIRYDVLLKLLLTSGLIPIFFYFFEIYKNEYILFREK